MSKPDSPELDHILQDLINVTFENAHEAVNNKQGFNNLLHITKAKAQLQEYYTNKFLECLPVPSQQTRGNTQNPDNPKYLTKFAAGYNQAIADTKQAIKQLSKRGE